MMTYNSQKTETFWLGLLNRSEARVLSSDEERALLVELVDCKTRILEALPRPDEPVWGEESARQTDFQQLIRDLADPDEKTLDSATRAILPLVRRYQELRTKLAMANVRLVAHVAKRYHDRGIPPGDLIQEGFCSLLVAIDRFDLVNQTRLATYAIWWIRQAIQRAVAHGAYPVRLNPRQLHQLAQMQRTIGGHELDRSTRADLPRPALSPTIERVFAATRPVISLDAPSRYNDTTPVVEFLIPPDDEDGEVNDTHESVGNLINTLDPREQLILKLRFGLEGETPRTLIQISHVLGVSKERVRQIQDRALKRLRTSPKGDQLRSRSTSASASPVLPAKTG
jgi:RNA polymerase primary sigma factor